jgi:hypothetical protein
MVRNRVLALTGILVVLALGTYVRLHRPGTSPVDVSSAQRISCRDVSLAFAARRSHVWLSFSGRVVKMLSDSPGPPTHQRFIVRCSSGMTVLVINDVDVGQRAPVQLQTHVAVHGEYIWNVEGGLVHFTHHDPSGVAPGGWIVAGGREYASAFEPDRPHRSAAHNPVETSTIQFDLV